MNDTAIVATLGALILKIDRLHANVDGLRDDLRRQAELKGLDVAAITAVAKIGTQIGEALERIEKALTP